MQLGLTTAHPRGYLSRLIDLLTPVHPLAAFGSGNAEPE